MCVLRCDVEQVEWLRTQEPLAQAASSGLVDFAVAPKSYCYGTGAGNDGADQELGSYRPAQLALLQSRRMLDLSRYVRLGQSAVGEWRSLSHPTARCCALCCAGMLSWWWLATYCVRACGHTSTPAMPAVGRCDDLCRIACGALVGRTHRPRAALTGGVTGWRQGYIRRLLGT